MAVAVAGCGGDGSTAATTTREATTTTTAAATTTTSDCGGSFSFPVEVAPSPECRRVLMLSVLNQQKVSLTIDEEAAVEQAKSICRTLDSTDPATALVRVLADWTTGAKERPTDDQSGFLVAAIGSYCPEFYGALRDAT
jgi:hypothetical protein